MPLKAANSLFKNPGLIAQSLFWAAVFLVAYFIMMKVMHPGWGFMGF